jgi:thymidylate synthase
MNSHFEEDYISLVDRVLAMGEDRPSRAGETRSLFGRTLHIDSLQWGYFPILTKRKMFLDPVLGELAAFLRGAEMLSEFKEQGCNYWDANAAAWPVNKTLDPELHLVGKIYGAQWRKWTHGSEAFDQIDALVKGIIKDPYGRRHLLTAYNPAELNLGCLPPCHLLAQFYVSKGFLDCIVTMRSVDLCLGLPSDIILYAALLIILGAETRLLPGRLTFHMGDSHVYVNHFDEFDIYKKQKAFDLPTWSYNPYADVDTFESGDLALTSYQHSPKVSYAFNV